jgi:hypothetical protein
MDQNDAIKLNRAWSEEWVSFKEAMRMSGVAPTPMFPGALTDLDVDKLKSFLVFVLAQQSVFAVSDLLRENSRSAKWLHALGELLDSDEDLRTRALAAALADQRLQTVTLPWDRSALAPLESPFLWLTFVIWEAFEANRADHS